MNRSYFILSYWTKNLTLSFYFNVLDRDESTVQHVAQLPKQLLCQRDVVIGLVVRNLL